MAHLPPQEVHARLMDARRRVEIGGRYFHYKNPAKVYRVMDIALFEANDEPAVLYRIENGKAPELIWIRPVASFCETVEHEGTIVPRFTKLD